MLIVVHALSKAEGRHHLMQL
ncbi:hypothetical protein MH117_18410 [Paenibacillus sp. ACRRX]|nr:hypothetical protein [Paenibacillus sp. ACRRX]